MIRCQLCEGQNARRLSCLHDEPQDVSCDAWLYLLELVEKAAKDRQTRFAPFQNIPYEQHSNIVTLPSTIETLSHVRELHLYGSQLTRIPPEIGGMQQLRVFTPYTSARLHWLPYEITRCAELIESTVSTRHLYGNYKLRPPFPHLKQAENKECFELFTPKRCSVCNGEFKKVRVLRRWISLRVATDILPLLVHACSKWCVNSLPVPPENYVRQSHIGGLHIQQPPTQF